MEKTIIQLRAYTNMTLPILQKVLTFGAQAAADCHEPSGTRIILDSTLDLVSDEGS